MKGSQDHMLTFRSAGVVAGVMTDASEAEGVILPVQTHSCNVAVIPGDGAVPSLDDTDAVISLDPRSAIGIRTADCVPLVIHCPDIRAVAAIHAGWRGSLGGIVDRTLEMLFSLGADPALAEAAFGPSICGECYEVSPELAGEFAAGGFTACILGERNVDLEAVNCLRLVHAGVAPDNIQAKRFCTRHTPRFPSWRREPTSRRLLTWIQLTEINQ